MVDSIGILFFKSKQVRLFALLSDTSREWHITDLSRAAEVTYIHTSNFVKKCELEGLVVSEKHGRTKRLGLTPKGREVAKGIAGVMEKIASQEEKPHPQAAE